MSVILRVDDFPGAKPEEFWKFNLENFKRFDALIERHRIEGYTLGVIPKHVTDEQIRWLTENQRIEVALHGIDHDERFQNEFRDHETVSEIHEKIVSASETLKCCNGFGDVIRYIPPHNVIDAKTCHALSRAGFTTVMTGPGTSSDIIEIGENIYNLFFIHSDHPIWYGRSDEMMYRDGAVEKILASEHMKNRCLTLHWTWEWNVGLDSLDKFLGKIGSVLRERHD